MKRVLKSSQLLIMLVLIFSMVSCAPKGEATPTIDPNMIYTEAAATVSAQLTANAPQPTVAPAATATAIPERPTTTLAALPTINQTAITQAVAVTQMVATAEPVNNAADDKIEDIPQFLGQYPGDGYAFPPGSKFDARFTFKNNGPNTWTPLYSLRRITWKGESFGAEQSKYLLEFFADRTTVHKGEETTITLPGLQAPQSQGQHQSWWCLTNNREDVGKDPQCIYVVSIEILVR